MLKDNTSQMTGDWIENRLLDALGGKKSVYLDILDKGYQPNFVRINPDGSVTTKLLDESAHIAK
ncbi:MAG: hypothetical protein MSC45_08210 [Mobiluncus sp.]|uniref:hypothetical protein n=2 Tax=Actinomycetaceae TaxID=2049 RepID=UPI0012B1C85E|nr:MULTISPECIES: hypothetical protein [Mobiluncus]MCI6585031.1 hypothetical protein [Mobiluncus sp.]MDD7541640.1 hypothetical protein [Mobiluncus porci]